MKQQLSLSFVCTCGWYEDRHTWCPWCGKNIQLRIWLRTFTRHFVWIASGAGLLADIPFPPTLNNTLLAITTCVIVLLTSHLALYFFRFSNRLEAHYRSLCAQLSRIEQNDYDNFSCPESVTAICTNAWNVTKRKQLNIEYEHWSNSLCVAILRNKRERQLIPFAHLITEGRKLMRHLTTHNPNSPHLDTIYEQLCWLTANAPTSYDSRNPLSLTASHEAFAHPQFNLRRADFDA